jgi:predicted kinase
LPAGPRVCYKPDMRKWMRDRLQRRKKPAEKAKTEAPAPLQPAFYDSEPQPAAPEPKAPESESESQPQLEAGSPEPVTPPKQAAADPRKRRRRRGRGGRVRKPSAEAARAPASSPSATEPAESAVEGETEPVAPAADIPPQVPPAARPSRGTVVLAIGLPGSGKSSWFKRHNITPLSSDVLRVLLFDDPTEQRYQDLIFSNLRSMLRARLIARRPLNYVDATNLTSHDRQGWIKLAKDYGYDVQAVFFDVPLEVCLERNQKRERVVPEDVMRRMAGKMKAPKFEEGFSKITVVRVKNPKTSDLSS